MMEIFTSPELHCYTTLSYLKIQNSCVSKITCKILMNSLYILSKL